jgi:hypothetical protein
VVRIAASTSPAAEKSCLLAVTPNSYWIRLQLLCTWRLGYPKEMIFTARSVASGSTTTNTAVHMRLGGQK